MPRNQVPLPEARIFISHASQEADKASALREELLSEWRRRVGQDGGDVQIDAYTLDSEAARDLKDLWRRLRRCTALISIVEANFLGSPTCIEELVRADESGVLSWWIALSDRNNGELLSKAPFLDASRSVMHESRGKWDATCKEFCRVFFDYYLADEGFLPSLVEANKIRRQVLDARAGLFSAQFADLPPQKRQASVQVVRSAVRDAVQISGKGEYELDLSASSSFLEWAVSHFSNAETVAAVSRNEISEFWVREENRALVRKYIDGQSAATIRLFAFDSPQSCNNYRDILNKSDESYGESGAVVICSRQALVDLLERMPSLRDDSRESDFGVLHLRQERAQESIPMYARLERHRLVFRDPPKALRADLAKLSSTLESFKAETDAWRARDSAIEDHGVARAVLGSSGDEIRAMRWKSGCGMDAGEWAESLSWLFSSQLVGDIKHVVFFDITQAQREVLSALRPEEFERDLMLVKEDHFAACREEKIGLKEVWVGRRAQLRAVDSRTDGRLITDRDGGAYQYALAATFDTREDLERWYRSTKHSEFRERLYGRLDRRVASLFGDLAAVKLNESRMSIWGQIEDRVSDSIARFDWSILEDFKLIVQREPYSLGG